MYTYILVAVIVRCADVDEKVLACILFETSPIHTFIKVV